MSAEEDQLKVVCPECGGEYGEGVETCPDDGAELVSFTISETGELDPLVGTVLDDRFRIESVLGEGGMGKVYRAEQMSIERDVAVKVVHAEHYDDETVIKRFFREARVISKFSHPNIVNLIDFGRDDESDVLYFVMELIEGHPLEEMLGEGRIAPDLAVEVAEQTCQALSEPHSHGIVHRDLKPDNLMLLPISDGSVQTKVVDFGVAQALQSETKLTKTGAVCGTPHYMAPEQAEGGDVGPETDLYALGVILYEMLAGRPPFGGDKALQIMLSHVQEEHDPLERALPPGSLLPEELSRLVDDLLTKDPAERPDDVLAVRDRLSAIAERHDFGPIRVDPAADVEEMFDGWLLAGPETQQPDPSGDARPATDASRAAPSTGAGRESIGESAGSRDGTGQVDARSPGGAGDSTGTDSDDGDGRTAITEVAAEFGDYRRFVVAGVLLGLSVGVGGYLWFDSSSGSARQGAESPGAAEVAETGDSEGRGEQGAEGGESGASGETVAGAGRADAGVAEGARADAAAGRRAERTGERRGDEPTDERGAGSSEGRGGRPPSGDGAESPSGSPEQAGPSESAAGGAERAAREHEPGSASEGTASGETPGAKTDSAPAEASGETASGETPRAEKESAPTGDSGTPDEKKGATARTASDSEDGQPAAKEGTDEPKTDRPKGDDSDLQVFTVD
ncbi:MAG: protein kinase [Bradymonadaceae bacterium]